MKKTLLFVLALIAASPVALEAQLAERAEEAEAKAKLEIINEVYRGRDCEREDQSGMFNALTCTYRVGQDLEFMIRGIGGVFASLTVNKADREGDFTLILTFDKPGPSPELNMGKPQCIRVMTGPDNATYGEFVSVLVSPWTGDVYANLLECWEASRN